MLLQPQSRLLSFILTSCLEMHNRLNDSAVGIHRLRLTQSGHAEGGRALRLEHGSSDEASANLGAPTHLYHWLVACHGHEPVVVIRR